MAVLRCKWANSHIGKRKINKKKLSGFFLLLRQKYSTSHFTTKRSEAAFFCTYWHEKLQQDVVGPAVWAPASRAASVPWQSPAEEEETQRSAIDWTSSLFGVSKKWNAPRRRPCVRWLSCGARDLTWRQRGGAKAGEGGGEGPVSGVQVFLCGNCSELALRRPLVA